MMSKQFTVVRGRILNTAVRMMDQSGAGVAAGQRHAQSRYTKARLQSFSHGPTDYHSAPQIQQDGQIQPALSRPNISNIATPGLIDAACFLNTKTTSQEIFGHRILMLRVGGRRPSPP